MMTGRIFTFSRSLAKNIDIPFQNPIYDIMDDGRPRHYRASHDHSRLRQKNVACFQAPVRKENVNPSTPPKPRAFAATVGQIVLLDLVLSIDSIITAAGMTGDVLIMTAGGFGFHFPKRYIYAAMAFSGAVAGLDMLARRRRKPSPK
jgi:predicted tellurium resistance membrane protein TerC